MYLPKWLYDALPAVYILIGFGSAHLPTSWMSFFGGFLFCAAGIIVYNLRKNEK